MTTLAACPSCSRHVRIDELRCPFCAHALVGAFDDRPARRSVVGRFSRAALFALGAAAAAAGTTLACSSSDDTEEGPAPAPLYGGPPVSEDAGGTPDNDSGTPAALYGGAPVLPDGG